MKKTLFLALLLALSSCITAEKHLQKFYEKGGKLEPVERIVTLYDTIPGKDGKDSIVERLIEVPCPEPQAPKTRWQVRFDNKRFNDSLKHIRKMYGDSVSYVLDSMELSNERLIDSLKRVKPIVKSNNRLAKAESRHENFGFFDYLWLTLAFIAGFLLRHLIYKILQ